MWLYALLLFFLYFLILPLLCFLVNLHAFLLTGIFEAWTSVPYLILNSFLVPFNLITGLANLFLWTLYVYFFPLVLLPAVVSWTWTKRVHLPFVDFLPQRPPNAFLAAWAGWLLTNLPWWNLVSQPSTFLTLTTLNERFETFWRCYWTW